MKKKLLILLVLSGSGCLFSFFTQRNSSPADKLVSFYTEQMHLLSKNISALRTAVVTRQNTATLQHHFLQARLSYKKLELILSYYYEGDLNRFNGLAVNFIEEEDPTAFQEPQGFQVIETLLYPAYNSKNQADLLLYIDKLANITEGLGGNSTLFHPGPYVPDAIMEELYRLISLGITGF